MPLHPDMILDVRTMQKQDLLAQAEWARLIDEATKGRPAPSPIGVFRTAVRQVFAWFGTISAIAPRSRQTVSAWR